MYLSDAVRDRIRFYQGQTGMSLWGLLKLLVFQCQH